MSGLSDKIEIFCSVGRGNEVFSEQEVEEKLHATLTISQYKVEGKLLFSCGQSFLGQLHCLKSVERIFLLVKHDPQISLKFKSDFYNLVSSLEEIDSWPELYSRLLSIRKDEEDADCKPAKIKKEEDCRDVTFRVSCRCRQKAAKLFDVKRLSRTISTVIARKTNWKVDLKKPYVEIVVHINDDGTLIGIPVFEKPLAERSYLKHHGLRSTTSWILGRLADIQTGDVVLDPMCGNGVILVEAAKEWKGVTYVGSDVLAAAVERCHENIKFADEGSAITVLQADITNLPFKENSVDRIVCDLPFGVNYSSIPEIEHLYPKCVRSMDRVLKHGGTVVLLTSSRMKSFLINCCCCQRNHQPRPSHVRQGYSCASTDKSQPSPSHSCIETRSPHGVEGVVIPIANSIAGGIDEVSKDGEDQTKVKSMGKENDNKFVSNDQCSEEGKAENSDVNLENIELSYCVKWTLVSEHYLKLGETHAFACKFKKSLT